MKYITLILLLFCLNVHAQTGWQTGHDGAYTYRFVPGDPMHARFYTLKNGLTVILSVNKKEPRIRTLIGTRAGSNNDPANHTGLAHYLEHLLFKGTTTYGSLDWDKESPYIDQITNLYTTYNHTTDLVARKAVYHQIDSVSGIAAHYAIPNEYDKLMSAIGSQETNAHTAMEETVFEENIPSGSLDQYLAVQAERFRYPVFRLFHTELEAVYEEKNRGLDNDAQKVYAAMNDGLFPTTNYGQQTTIGTIEHLKNPSLVAIRDFYNKWYVPNNMAIVMAGDLDPSTTIRKIDAAFGYMKAKPVSEYNPAPEKPIAAPVVKNVYGPDAESVTIAYRMPGIADHQAQVLLEVLADLLSNGKAGLMDIDLNQQQKVQSAGAGNDSYRLYSFLQLAGKAKPGQNLDEVKNLLLAEVDRIRRGDFDQTLVKAIVNNQKLDLLQALSGNDFRASALISEFTKDKGEYWPQNVAFQHAMLQVTKPQIVAFAKEYTGNNYVIVYKHTGVDSTIIKVDKPAITPIFINKDTASAFLKKIEAMPKTPVAPQWVDYDKVIQKKNNMLYVQNKENGLFSLTYRFDMGSWNNKLLPLAAGYLDFLGTDKQSAAQLSRAFYNIACSYDISVGGDESTITISGLQENFTQAVGLFEKFIYGCKPDEAALAAFKGRLAKSRSDAKLDKDNISKALINYAIYGPKNHYNDELTNAELNAVSAQQLTVLLHRFMHYPHQVCYYGPKPLAQLQIPAIQQSLVIPPAEKFQKTDQTSNQVLFADYDMVQAEIYWIRNTEPYRPDETARIAVFNDYFGTGMAGIVFQTIRESKALAYSTYAQYATPDKRNDRDLAIAYVGAQADKMKEAVSSMNELLDSIPENRSLLENSREDVRQEIANERVQPEEYIGNYLANQKLGLKGDDRKAIYETAAQVDFAALKKLHDTQLKAEPYTYCVLGSDKNISEQELSAYGPVKKLTLEDLFGY